MFSPPGRLHVRLFSRRFSNQKLASLLLIAASAHRLVEQVLRRVDLRQQSLNLVPLVWAGAFMQTFKETKLGTAPPFERGSTKGGGRADHARENGTKPDNAAYRAVVFV